jgi:MinD-like ATPase involved in chromosome partitioning or flagellar assembly
MSKILAVHSFRGGTGKSNVTANLAVTVASRGNRVGIIDTDIVSPGIHILFGLDEERIDRTLNDYLWGRSRIEEAAYDVSDVLTGRPASRKTGAIMLVPSSMKAGEIARILREGYDVDLLNDGYRDAIADLQLDYLFIDTHPGLNEETLLSIAVADVAVLILRPDHQDFQGTAVTVDVARKLDVTKMILVVNKALSDGDLDDLERQVTATYDVPVAGVLPLTEDMVRLASGGIFVREYPDHPWSQTLAKIADEVMR